MQYQIKCKHFFIEKGDSIFYVVMLCNYLERGRTLKFSLLMTLLITCSEALIVSEITMN